MYTSAHKTIIFLVHYINAALLNSLSVALCIDHIQTSQNGEEDAAYK